MIEIEKLKQVAEEKRKENSKFRTYLKNHADPEILDEQFKELHEKYFSTYDCSKCRNCCKEFKGRIPMNELERDSSYLNLTIEAFKDRYLEDKIEDGCYNSKNIPCDFYDGKECILGENRPNECKEFPFTNKEGRFWRLWGIMDNTEICPVLYEIVEELKKIYNFR